MPAGPSPSSARTRRRGLLPWTPDIEQGGAWVWHLSRATHHQPTAQPLWPSTICRSPAELAVLHREAPLKYQQLSTARNRRSEVVRTERIVPLVTLRDREER